MADSSVYPVIYPDCSIAGGCAVRPGPICADYSLPTRRGSPEAGGGPKAEADSPPASRMANRSRSVGRGRAERNFRTADYLGVRVQLNMIFTRFGKFRRLMVPAPA